MTDILFINTTQDNRLRSQINGTMILATKLLDAGFDVNILRFFEIDSDFSDNYYKFVEKITNKIIEMNPKCVSFYTLWPYYHLILRIAQNVKERNSNIIVVMGGPQSSATASATMEAMGFVDYVSTGEGENTVVPFFDCILRQNRSGIEKIAGLYYREDNKIIFNNIEIALCDLDAVPHWDEKLYTFNEVGVERADYFMPIDAGRGCPYNCTFCCTSFFWKRTYRLKSPRRIIEDIKFYYEKFGIKSFWFSHDAFTTNQKLVSEVCDHIIEDKLDIKWKCTARIDCINEELILKMKKAGMTRIELGVETGSSRMQKLIKKNLDLNKVREKVKFLIDNKIVINLFFMYGFPEETEADLNQTVNLIFDFVEMGVKEFSMSYCKFNPATDITERYFDQLIYAPEIKILSRDVFGYSEEAELIKSNKEIFSPFYHLNTSVRNNYQYIAFLTLLYRRYSNSLKYVRRYYKEDTLKFYSDFYNNNIDIFNSDMSVIKKNVRENPVKMIRNTIKDFDKVIANRICAMMEYDFDLQTLAKSKEDMTIKKTYDFNYIEYQMKIPLELYTEGSTELLLEKKNGKINVSITHI